MKDRNEMEIMEVYKQKWNKCNIWTYEWIMTQWFLKKRNENYTLMHKTLAEQGPSTPALATVLKYELSWKTESSYIKKQSLQKSDVTAQVQRNHIT